jgi:competence protein ComEA
MGWKDFAGEYFRFTRQDRLGIIALVILILAVYFIPFIVSRFGNRNPSALDSVMISALQTLEKSDTQSEKPGKRYSFAGTNSYQRKTDIKLFEFDPNSISDKEWKKLGLRDRTIKTIRNYLEKGGRFREPRDLKKIYGLYDDEFERLLPFIRIEKSTSSSFHINPGIEKKDISRMKELKVEINSADTIAFIELPGIGPKLAARIVKFRERLGGFYSVEQVGETFGLADSVYQKIKPLLYLDNPAVQKLDINIASADELKAHPYIRWELSKLIIAYRTEHGPFKSLDEIKNIATVNEQLYQKLKNYIRTE